MAGDIEQRSNIKSAGRLYRGRQLYDHCMAAREGKKNQRAVDDVWEKERGRIRRCGRPVVKLTPKSARHVKKGVRSGRIRLSNVVGKRLYLTCFVLNKRTVPEQGRRACA